MSLAALLFPLFAVFAQDARRPVAPPTPSGAPASTRDADVAAARAREIRARLEAEPASGHGAGGITLHGSVRTESGEPVAGAELRLVERRPEGGASVRGGMATSGEDGRFEIRTDHEGRVHVLARASGRGTAVSDELELDPFHPPGHQSLVLGGSGELSGQIVDRGGEPVGGTELHLVPEGMDRVPDLAVLAALEDGSGLASDGTVTDDEGRFRFTGLVPGRYRLLLGERRPRRAIAGTFQTGSDRLRVVAGGNRLVLRVLDHDGRPVRLAKPAGRNEGGRPWGPRLVCVRSDGRGRSLHPDAWLPAGEVVPREDGAAVIEVEPDRSYLVGYVAPEIPPVLREVFVPREEARREVRLELPPPVLPGHLSIAVRVPGGSLHRDARDPLAFTEVRVLEHASGLLLARPTYRGQSSRFTWPLPPGAYDVVAEERKWIFCATGLEEPLVADFSPAAGSAEVFTGRRTELELTLGGSARIEIETDLPPASVPGWEEIADLLRRHDSLEAGLEGLRRELGGLRVRLVGPGGHSFVPDFFVEPLGLLEVPWILPGALCRTTTPLPPGPYEVLVETPDGRTLRGHTNAVHGETSTVRPTSR